MKKYLIIKFFVFILILVASIFVLFPHTSSAGWIEQQGSGLHNWKSIASDSTGTYLVAVPYETTGHIYTSIDGGVIWTERTVDESLYWQSVTSDSTGQNLAVASDYYVYTSTNYGVNWTQIFSSGTGNWRSITSSSDGTKLAIVDYMGYIYTSANSGGIWTLQANSGVNYWNSITSSSDGTELAATGYNRYIKTSINSGFDWTQQNGSGSRFWTSITSDSTGQNLAATVTGGYIFTSANGGIGWTQRTNAGSHTWQSIASDSTGENLVAAYTGAANNYIVTSANYGVDWTPQTNAGSHLWKTVASNSDGTKLVAGVGSGGSTTGYIYTYDTTTEAPTVTTQEATNVLSTTATLNGNITDLGGDNINMTRGFEYGTTIAYGTEIAPTGNFMTGAYTYNLTGLECGEHTYHYRAIATNSVDTGNGVDKTFVTTACTSAPTVTTQDADNITLTTATLHGNITDVDEENATTRGFEYGETESYDETTIETEGGPFNTGAYTANITGLTCGKEYNFRSYATNGGGTGDGANLTFETSACPTAPTMTTQSAGTITQTGAILNGNMTNNGGEDATERGFYYGITTAYGQTISSTSPPLLGTGAYTKTLTGLTCGITYHYKAFATNTGGTGEGASDVEFSTTPCTIAPTVVTEATSLITSTTARLNGDVTFTGYESVIERGFEYGITTAYGLEKHSTGTFSTGAYAENITSLLCNTTYHFRAYAKNSQFTSYSADAQFTTTACISPPTLTTQSAISVARDTATLRGTIDTLGENATTRGFYYGTTTSYGSTSSETGSYPVGAYTINVSSLLCETTYHYQAFATNGGGTGLGNDQTFLTTDCTIGDWTQQNGSGKRNWKSVTSDSTGQYLAAVVNGGYIYTSINSGETWIERTDAGSRSWYSIASDSTGQKLAAVAANNSMYVYTSDDGGASWTETLVGGSGNWRSIASSSNGNKLAMVDGVGYIYTSANSGGTWTFQGGSGSKYWSSISSDSTGQYLVATNNGGYIYISNDSGVTWEQKDASGQRAWTSITSDSTGNKLAAVATNNGNYIYVSSNRGVSWAQKTTPGIHNWQSIASSSDGTKLIAGYRTSGAIYISTNSGTDWTQQTNAGSRSWQAVASDSTGNKLVAGVGYNTTTGYIYTYDTTTEAPTLTTGEATLLAQTTATLNGEITDLGGAESATTRGFHYGTSLSYGSTSSTTGTYIAEAYTANITGLTCGTLYYFRSFAISNGITGYGNNMTFTTSACPGAPTLTTGVADTLARTTATLNGTIDSVDGNNATSRGFYYGETTAYGFTTTTTGSFPAQSFFANIIGLTCATTYHFKAYAINVMGPGNGDDASFTTSDCPDEPILTTDPASSIERTTVTLNSTISDTDGDDATTVGFEYGDTTAYGTTTEETGSFGDDESFTADITDLTCETTYHFKAYAENTGGSGYGDDREFTTDDCIVPTLTTGGASSIEKTTATLSGTITDLGGENADTRGFEYGLTTNYNLASYSDGLFSAEAYTANISALTCETTYHYRASAENSAGYGFGEDQQFTTSNCSSGGGGGGGSSSNPPIVPPITPTTIPLGCTSTTLFSPITGQSCPAPSIGCTSTTLFSPLTGLACPINIVPLAPTLTRTLKLNMEGEDVKALQIYLNTHGYIIATTGNGSPGNESIFFGLKTKTAVIKFQIANGLTPDGAVGPKTKEFINQLSTVPTSPVTPTPTPTPTPTTRTLKLNMEGEDVKALQIYLNTHGYIIATTGNGSPGNESIFFGLKTKTAVIKFQIANGLTPDGAVGARTREAMK